MTPVFSISNERIFCGFPSSRTVKSSAFRSRTKSPFLSFTVTLTSTRSVFVLMVNGVAFCGIAGAAEIRIASKQRNDFARTESFMTYSKPVSKDDLNFSHGSYRRHLAERRRIDGGIYGSILHDVE